MLGAGASDDTDDSGDEVGKEVSTGSVASDARWHTIIMIVV